MNHKHVGPLDEACDGCFREAQGILEDLRARRFWGWVLLGFSFALAVTVAIVLFKMGRPS